MNRYQLRSHMVYTRIAEKTSGGARSVTFRLVTRECSRANTAINIIANASKVQISTEQLHIVSYMVYDARWRSIPLGNCVRCYQEYQGKRAHQLVI